MNIKNFKKSVQSGFTLVELIIVIVILGILAAVAIPKLSDTSGAAVASVANATLGALKSSWSAAYAKNNGVAPNADLVAQQMADPICTATAGIIKCAGVFKADGTTQYSFPTGATSNTAAVLTPSALSVTP